MSDHVDRVVHGRDQSLWSAARISSARSTGGGPGVSTVTAVSRPFQAYGGA